MAWKETCTVDQRMRLVVAYEGGDETVAGLCRQYGISRKTGSKWVRRYAQEGLEGLKDRSRASKHPSNGVSQEGERAVLAGVVQSDGVGGVGDGWGSVAEPSGGAEGGVGGRAPAEFPPLRSGSSAGGVKVLPRAVGSLAFCPLSDSRLELTMKAG
jgi:hypothetical protein